MTAFCPRCGYDLEQHRLTADGPFTYHPAVGFAVDGVRLRAAPKTHELLGAVMLLGGEIARPHVLADRLGYDGDGLSGYLGVQVHHARVAIAATGHAFPVETIRAVGLRWNVDALPAVAVRHRASRAETRA